MPKQLNNDMRLDMRVPKELADAAKQKAAAEKRTLSEVMRDLLRAWVRRPAK
jgi:predicted DNA binding CopG/RHH family protein